MYYLQSRYYDARIGRFINADDPNVLEDLDDDNLFKYCNNNPLLTKDITGKGVKICKSPKYNKLYKMSQKDKRQVSNFNCYAYVIGRREICIPGRISGAKNQYGYAQVYRPGDNVERVLRYTISDLTKLKYKVKEVNKSYKPKKNQTMIAIRTCSEDFNYMLRMKDGTWTHKPGQTHVLQLKKKPWNYKKWHVEAYIYKNKWLRTNDFAYNSEIKYLVYWK